jgi:hypothetical protein
LLDPFRLLYDDAGRRGTSTVIHLSRSLPVRVACGSAAVVAAIVCWVFMLAWPATGIAAEWPKQATISIAGTFPARVIGPKTTAPQGDPSTYSLNATIELRGDLVVYGAADGRFETTLNGASAKSTAPARCNDKLTNTARQTQTRAYIAAGLLYVVRNDETKFPKSGACGGTTDDLDETLGFKLENGACSFGYTGVHKRNGAILSSITIVDQRCDITLPGQPPKPAVAQTAGAAAAPPVSGGNQTAPAAPVPPNAPPATAQQQPFASAGCAALNGTVTINGDGVAITGNEEGEGFSAGDKITATTTGGVIILLTDETAQWKELAPLGSGFTYVVPAATNDRFGLGASLKDKGDTGTARWSCTPSGRAAAAAPVSGGNQAAPAAAVPSNAAQPPAQPACGDASAGSAPQNLTLIKVCTAIYCSAADPNARANLETIDSKLVELQITTAQTRNALEHFKRACRAIGGDMTKTGPAMDDFRQATFQLGIDQGKLKDEYDAIQTDPLESVFANTSSAMARPPYGQPACMQQINQQTIDSLNTAQDVLQQVEIDCTAETIKKWQ